MYIGSHSLSLVTGGRFTVVTEEGWVGISEVADQFRTANESICQQVNRVGFPARQRALRFVSARQPGKAAP